MRRLHPRGPTSLGVAVDADGAMLGPDFILVRRIAQGYRCITADEATAVQDFLLDGREPDWLFRQCRRIAKALDNGEIALAQIIGLHIPIGDLDGGQLGRLARAAPLIKANFDPDQSRIPAGQPGGGQWTSEGESAAEGPDGSTGPTGGSDSSSGGDQSGDGGGDGGGDVGSASDTEDNDANLMPVAYQGYYHDEVVVGLKEYLTAHGGTVITSVPLTAVEGSTAIADMMVKFPGHSAFVIEVKTGENPQFTPSQRRVYPMVQVGGHVTSSKTTLDAVGLTPGDPLPPLDVWIYWAHGPGQPVEVIKLPPPEFVP